MAHSSPTYQRQPAGKLARTAPVASIHTPTGPLQKQPVGAPLSGVAPPPAAADPATVAPPYDPQYQAYVLGAGRNVSIGNNEATYQTQQTGYDLGYDATGAFNAANPYSQAQLLQDNYHRSQLGTTNSMAAQGQLYSGSLLNAQAANDRGYSQSDAALRRQAQAAYHGIQANQLQNYATNAVGVTDQAFNALNRATYGG